MIDVNKFCDCLKRNGFDFFTGVPDSLLNSFCLAASDIFKERFIISANEGNAVATAAGHYIAEGKAAVVFMQNSGIGNAVNPLLSLADEKVYNIPMLIITGWRGEPGVKDEPQHIHQGELTCELFDTMGIETIILDEDYENEIACCAEKMKQGKIISIIVRKGVFSDIASIPPESEYKMTREQALEIITENIDKNDIVVSTTGKISRELYELREKSGESHGNDFLTVGSMGHASSIALGISLSVKKNVYCIDGDGSFIMHMGACAVNAAKCGDNFKYIIINNGAHESVGGQPTVGNYIDMEKILSGCGFENVFSAKTASEAADGIKKMSMTGKSAMVIYVKQGSRKDLGRPKITPIENRKLLMQNIKASKIKALIFNSGIGSRMGKFTKDRPKCLVELPNGETILSRQLRILSECGIREAIITTGKYTSEIISEAEKNTNIKFTFIENSEYFRTNYIYSMYLAKDYLDSDILMLHGDLVFDKKIVMKLLSSHESNICAVSCRSDLPEKDFKARVENGYLKEVSVNIFGDDCYAFQPMYRLSKAAVQRWSGKIDEYILAGKSGVYAENALNEILSELPVAVTAYDDCYINEIDNEDDFFRVGYDISCRNLGIFNDVKSLPELIKSLNAKRPFAVVGHHCAELFNDIMSDIKNAGLYCFTDYKENPDEDSIRNAAQSFLNHNADLLISMGGGSVIDTAKGIKAMVNSGVYHISIPTTAGSGSEATPFSVYYKNGVKKTFDSAQLLPDRVILDSTLLDSLSFKNKMITLLDALCHSAESLLAKGSTEKSRKYAQISISLIQKHFKGYSQGIISDSKMIFLASHFAGKAIGLSRTGAGHAMSYVLTSEYGIKHGQAVVICLKNVLSLLSARGKLPAEIEEVRKLLEEVYEYADLVTPSQLKKASVAELSKEINIERMNNFSIKLTAEDIITIYREILNNIK